jgi:hypothetical protein
MPTTATATATAVTVPTTSVVVGSRLAAPRRDPSRRPTSRTSGIRNRLHRLGAAGASRLSWGLRRLGAYRHHQFAVAPTVTEDAKANCSSEESPHPDWSFDRVHEISQRWGVSDRVTPAPMAAILITRAGPFRCITDYPEKGNACFQSDHHREVWTRGAASKGLSPEVSAVDTEKGCGKVSDFGGGLARDRRGRFTRRLWEPLPDLAAALSAVPGGLGVELRSSFTFAGVRWARADAALDGSPIGVCLAAELAGLEPPDVSAEPNSRAS